MFGRALLFGNASRVSSPKPRRTRDTRNSAPSGRTLRFEGLEAKCLLATFAVNSALDTVDSAPGDGIAADSAGRTTLRAAVMESNSLVGADTIVLGAGRYTFTRAGTWEDQAATGDLDIIGDTTLTGVGAGVSVIDGGQLDRIIDVKPGGSLTASQITFTGGGDGGNDGVGLYSYSANLALTDCVVSGNSAWRHGGGILFYRGSLLVDRCTISGNSGYDGGGMCIFGDGTATIRNTTISGNAAYDGAGLYIDSPGGTITLANCTIVGNTSTRYAGAMMEQHATVRLSNTIVAGNSASSAPFELWGDFVSLGNNFIRDVGTAVGLTNGVNGDRVGTAASPLDPLLGPLGDNGGPTPTHLPLPGSPVIDAGSASGVPAVDQRGVSRPQDGDGNGTGLSDIGAAEVEGAAFYSIDISGSTHRLVRINASTGAVDVVGTLGRAVDYPDLEVLDGRLFLQSTITGNRTELIELDPMSGAVISSVPVRLNGSDVAAAEGLTAQNGHLVLSYERGNAGGLFSNTIGDLALDGTVSNSTAFLSTTDFDSLMADSTGRLLGGDQYFPASTQTALLLVDRSAASTSQLAAYPTVGINDFAFSDAGGLFGIDSVDKSIRQFSPTAGSQLRAVSYDSTYTLRGLARVLPATRLRGQKFSDRNANGQRDADEAGINGWSIELLNAGGVVIASQTTHDLDLDGNGTIDPLGETGWYSFNAVLPGSYTVREVGRSSWAQTYPNSLDLVGPAYYAAGDYPEAVISADFNGDGWPDLAAADQYGSMSILMNVGNGTFSSPTTLAVGSVSSHLAAGDFDNDGDQDLAILDQLTFLPTSTPGKILIYLNNGSGSFTLNPSPPNEAGGRPCGLVARDFNRDGKLDLAADNLDSNTVTLLAGVGGGNFALVGHFPAGSQPRGITAGDFNGDGYPDIAVVNLSSAATVLLYDSTTAQFNTAQTFNTGITRGMEIVAGDWNGDGRDDLAAIADDGYASVLLNSGTGSFPSYALYAAGSVPEGITAGDLDGDADLDLVVGTNSSHDVRILRNNGSGVFAAAATLSVLPGGSHVHSVALADYNRDGTLDIAASAVGTDNVTVFLNRTGRYNVTLAPNQLLDTLHFGNRSCANTAPTDLELWPSAVAENQPAGTIVGVLSAADADPGETFTYSLAAGTGGGDNASFTVVDAQLKTAAGFDHESKNAYSIRVRSTDRAGGWYEEAFTIQVLPVPEITGRSLFYNNSAFDGNDPTATDQDYAAVAPAPPLSGHGHAADQGELDKQLGKQVLRPGQAATFVHYSSYGKGINGLLIAFDDLVDPASLSLADFTFRVGNDSDPAGWAAAPAPVAIRVAEDVAQSNFPGQPDVVTLVWSDEDPYTATREGGAISDQWLQVTVLAGGHAGLAANDVFYVGNQIGESGNSAADTNVDQNDEIGARNHPHTAFNAASISDPYDFNRDSKVDQNDEILVRNNPASAFTRIPMIAPPSMLQRSFALPSRTLAQAGSRQPAALDADTQSPSWPGIDLAESNSSADWLAPLAVAAAERWQAASRSAAEIHLLRQTRLVPTSFAGTTLAEASAGSNVLDLDADAAGVGWFVDPTPQDDEESSWAPGGTTPASPAGPAEDKMDRLTAVMHEMDHFLRRPDLDWIVDDLMAARLPRGVRRGPIR